MLRWRGGIQKNEKPFPLLCCASPGNVVYRVSLPPKSVVEWVIIHRHSCLSLQVNGILQRLMHCSFQYKETGGRIMGIGHVHTLFVPFCGLIQFRSIAL